MFLPSKTVRFLNSISFLSGMKKKVGLGPVKRYGVRYGRTTKYKAAKIEINQKKPQQCPYCGKPKAHRVFAGVYECSRCGAKFTGKAYYLEQKITIEQAEPEAEKTLLQEESALETEETTHAGA